MELGLQMAIGAPLAAARGWSHPENVQTYERARELASQIGESPELPRVLVEVAAAHLTKGDLATTAAVAQQALAVAERRGDAFDLLSAHDIVGMPLLYQGHVSRALHHFEQSIRLYNPSAHRMTIDRNVFAHSHAAECHVSRGHPDRALAASEAAVALAKRVEHPLTLAHALTMAGGVHVDRGEFDRGRERAEEVVGLAEQLGFPVYLEMGRLVRGWARVELGEAEAGLAEMQQALLELAAIGSGGGATGILCILAQGLRKVGRHDEALGTLGAGIAQGEQQGEHHYDAELHRLRAEILLDRDGTAVEEAEALFGQSLEIARRQEAKTFELRAAPPAWRGSGSARASAPPPAPSSPRSTPGSPKASPRAISKTPRRCWRRCRRVRLRDLR